MNLDIIICNCFLNYSGGLAKSISIRCHQILMSLSDFIVAHTLHDKLRIKINLYKNTKLMNMHVNSNRHSAGCIQAQPLTAGIVMTVLSGVLSTASAPELVLCACSPGCSTVR